MSSMEQAASVTCPMSDRTLTNEGPYLPCKHIKRAAMSSHFSMEQLAALHAEFLARTAGLKLIGEQIISVRPRGADC